MKATFLKHLETFIRKKLMSIKSKKRQQEIRNYNKIKRIKYRNNE